MEHIEDCLSFYLGKAYQCVTPVQYALLKVLWERDNQSGAEPGEREKKREPERLMLTSLT